MICLFFCIGNFAAALNTLFYYISIYFLTKVEQNYANDTQNFDPESSEDDEEESSKVQCNSYSSEKDNRDSDDGKVQQLYNSSDTT